MFKFKFQLTASLCCLALVALLMAQNVFAEVIQFKSGQNIKAPIVTQTDDYVKVDMGTGIVVTYYLEDIQKILADSKSSAEFEEYQKFLNQQLEYINNVQNIRKNNISITNQIQTPRKDNTGEINRVETQINDIEATVNNLNVDFSGQIEKFKFGIITAIDDQINKVKRFAQLLFNLATLKVIVENVLPSKIMLLIMASWMVACYPMMLLAKKRNEKYYWMAWFPILHIYLLTRLNQKSLWWVFCLFVPMLIIFMPFEIPLTYYKLWFFGGLSIGIFNFFVIPAILWSALSQEMNHPSWWGYLTIIPLVNVVMMHKLNQSHSQSQVSASMQREEYIRRIAPHLSNAN